MRTCIEPAIVSASVGAGKTVNIAALAKHMSDAGAEVLVLASQGELIEQNAAMARKCGLKLSVYSSALKSKSAFYPAVFGTRGTIVNSLTKDFKDKKIHTILIDECHQLNWKDLVPPNSRNPSMEDIIDFIKSELFNYEEVSDYAKIIAFFLLKNPKLRIIGYTGSPYRGTEDIIGPFWKKKLYDVDTMYLVGLGYLVPPIFGFTDDVHKYDLSEFTPSQDENNTGDFSNEVMKKMEKKLTKDKKLTEIIIEEVVSISEQRKGGVMITCAGIKHCEQVSEFLPNGTWAIITGATKDKKRAKILKGCRDGSIKYILQVGCLTTGVNVPPWSTSVILRRIGSLTLLTQLIGRILRILEDEDIANGFEKSDGLVLDYTDTFESFGDIFENQILDAAKLSRKRQSDEHQACPKCEAKNTIHAVRCIAQADTDDGRCEHFFKGSMCMKCDTMNSPTSRNCRKCDAIMIDPAKSLKNKAYTEADFKEVKSIEWTRTKADGGICITYHLNSTYMKNGIEFPEVAREFFKPGSSKPHERGKWVNFINTHVTNPSHRRMAFEMRFVGKVLKMKSIFNPVTHMTHRVNDKGFSIINRRRFLSGREVK